MIIRINPGFIVSLGRLAAGSSRWRSNHRGSGISGLEPSWVKPSRVKLSRVEPSSVEPSKIQRQ